MQVPRLPGNVRTNSDCRMFFVVLSYRSSSIGGALIIRERTLGSKLEDVATHALPHHLLAADRPAAWSRW